MAQKDRLKWDTKYSDGHHLIEKGEASFMLKRFYHKAPAKRALDVACGTGRNALFLAEHGFEVDALDISPVGLQRLQGHAEQISGAGTVNCQVVDLDEYSPPKANYDLIVVTNYLNRCLIPKLARELREGGVLVIDTFMVDSRSGAQDFNPDYLLRAGELPTYFDGAFEVLAFEDARKGRCNTALLKQAIAVRKIPA
ncbi:class I SAM-dependent methyltransferase [Profundibacter amoris]|uniref:Class I SAM-dependent methyltransferase n=1 Tax=Profundibacter amoris TaxID=2171755 RepID=A0A347UDS1_9RHOB|nr:class I SAM-dependent methyltransferase [Profundibacter amoris]AXX96999.1 class I SAM-dependent methyltransferase [Profundibacter amoris]